MLRRDFQEAAVVAFGNERVAVGEALGRANEAAVERAGARHARGRRARVLPGYFQRQGIELEDARMVAEGVIEAGRGAGIGGAVAGVPAVIENEDIAFAGEAARYHVRVVLADDLPSFRRAGVAVK